MHHDAPEPSVAGPPTRSVLVGALVAAGLAEGVGAAIAARPSVRVGALALVGAAAAVVAAGIVPVVVAGWLADRPRALGLRRAVSRSFGPEERPEVALTLALLAAALPVAAGAQVGTLLVSRMSARFAALGTAGVTLGAVLALALVAPELGGLLARLLPPARSERGARRRLAALLFAAALASGLGMAARLSLALALAPAAALAGAALVVASARPPRGETPASVPFGALALLALAAVALSAFGRFPPAAQRVVLYQTAYAAPLLQLAQSASDRDGDGYGTVLGGADCDDGDPTIHPGATDVSDNGVDEDCSGADARVYRPTAGTAWVRPSDAPPLNVLIVLVDALRPDHLGFAGYARPTTPRLDRFRETATWFRNAYTPSPSTRFALASMFTGYDVRRLPHRSLGGNRFELLGGASTVAERLAAIGYRTTGHTISYVIHHNLGLGQGFSTWGTPWPVDEWLANYPRTAELTTRAALATLEGAPAGGPPYLLFAHYRCTHDPYIAHPEWPFGERPVDRYDSALAYCDHHIGALLEAVEARPDAERTAIFVVSDHGELFGEHGHQYHGNSLYEPDVRVLLLARIPGAHARTVEAPVSLSDVAPTILGLAGLPAPPDMEGWSLVPSALGRPSPPRPLFLFTDLRRGNVHYRASAVLDFPHKLVRDLRTSSEELYDVLADPEEQEDLVDAGGALGETRARLRALLDGYEAFAATHRAGVTTP